MPYKTRKTDGYQVKNVETGKVHAKHTTKAKAQAQTNLLRGVEHGWKPTGKKARKVKGAAKGVVIGELFGGGPKRATGPAPAGPPMPIRTTREVITGKKG